MIFEATAILEQERNEELLFDGYRFRGLSINEWIEKIKFPSLTINPSQEEIVSANLKIIQIIEIVSENYAKAVALKKTAEFKYKNEYHKNLSLYMAELSSHTPPKRAPSSDVLEGILLSKMSHEVSSKASSEIFYEFWKTQIEKIEMINQRLSSVSFLSSR